MSNEKIDNKDEDIIKDAIIIQGKKEVKKAVELGIKVLDLFKSEGASELRGLLSSAMILNFILKNKYNDKNPLSSEFKFTLDLILETLFEDIPVTFDSFSVNTVSMGNKKCSVN